MNRKVKATFVIGPTASGKTTFIQNHFLNQKNTVILNVYDYQQAAYKEAGFSSKRPTFKQETKCLLKANENLLADIISALQEGKNVVTEQTLYKAKRRISYIDAIRSAVENINIEVYVMSPSDSVWDTYIKKRNLKNSTWLKSIKNDLDFPNLIEGFDKIYEVTDDDIRLRTDPLKPEIIDAAHKELKEEAQRMKKEEEEAKQRLALLESMNSRPFWHYCESCGTKVFCTAQEAYDEGWDYPPKIGTFGVLGPRTCGNCCMINTLYLKVMRQKIPIIIKSNLTENELRTWQRIKNEPESLLEEEK